MKQEHKIIDSKKITVITCGIILLGLVAWLDLITGTELSFSVFYMIPVLFVTWYTGRWSGILISLIASVITWFVADVETLTLYSSR